MVMTVMLLLEAPVVPHVLPVGLHRSISKPPIRIRMNIGTRIRIRAVRRLGRRKITYGGRHRSTI